MMSEEESLPPRRQKHLTACDRCRRRKVGCDASEMPNKRCSHCTALRIECQFNPVTKARRPTRDYVEALEERVRTMEQMVRKVQSESCAQSYKATADANLPHVAVERIGFGQGVLSHEARKSICQAALSSLLHQEPTNPALDGSDDEEEENTVGCGYMGKSSNKNLVLTLLGIKNDQEMRKKDTHGFLPRPPPLEFELPLINGVEVPPHTGFPHPNLLDKLVDLFFKKWNIYLPLLHRPSFEASIRDGLHLRDRGFGTIVLLVCAVGSNYLDNERAAPPDPTTSRSWQWFRQVGGEPWSLLARPQLHDLQACVLMAAYSSAVHLPSGDWTMLSMGIRMAQDVGAHRKKMYSKRPTPEQEPWKRAWWILVAMDRVTSFGLGRPCAVQDEDFDLDPMTEVDDEYWANPDPALAFKQPPGKPSKVAFANQLNRLLKVLACASRSIYTINKSKLLFGFVGAEWKQGVVAELDSALNEWISGVPPHLRWDPNKEDITFFNQSASLYTTYYMTQISVHRQFIPTSRRAQPALALPSLTICANAARSCVNVVHMQYQRTGVITCALQPMQLSLFTACIVLLVNLWGGSQSEKEEQSLREGVQKCLGILKDTESSNPMARKVRAAIQALVSIQYPKLSSSTSRSFEGGRANLGDLMTQMLENLRISLDESGCPPIDIDETVTCTAQYETNLRSHSSPSPFVTMLEGQPRTGRLSSIIAQGGDFDVRFPRPTSPSQYRGDPQPNSGSAPTSTTATSSSFSAPTVIPAIAISNALPMTDDFAMEYGDILSSLEISQILAGITPGDFSTAFPVTCKPPDFSDFNTMGMGAGMDIPNWLHNPGIGLEGDNNNLPWARPTGPMAALSEEEWDAFLRATSPPTSCRAHDTHSTNSIPTSSSRAHDTDSAGS